MMSVVATDAQEMLAGLTCASFLSRNGGESWVHHRFPVERCFDPWITITPDGHAIFTAFAGRRSALVVFKSKDAGATWTETPDTLGEGHDHPTSVVAPSSLRSDGRSYILSSQTIRLADKRRARVLFVARSASTDSAFVRTAYLRPGDLDLFGEMPVVLSDGTLVISYTESTDSAGKYLPMRRAWTMSSSDGGQTFSPPVFIGEACGPPYRLSWLTADLSDGPFRDRLYFACNLPGPSGVVVHHSLGERDAWSEAVPVGTAIGDTTVRRKVMALAVNEDGVVGVAWSDGRNAPAGQECFDIYFAASLDGGETFLSERRVTEAVSCPDPLLNGVIGRIFASSGGDYLGMVTDADGRFLLLWSDARDGAFRLRRASVTVSGDVGMR